MASSPNIVFPLLILFSFAVVSGAAALDPLVSSGGGRATPTDAKAMLDKAITHYKVTGRESALADFNAKKAPFADRDLYVFCIGPDHTLVANGGFRQFVGQSADLLKDSDGKSVGEAGWNIATSKGEGELHYQFFNPVTMLIESKVAYFAKAGVDVCAVGAYDPNKH